MHTLARWIALTHVMFFCLSSTAAFAVGPGILIDYTRLEFPFGLSDLPAALANQVPGPVEDLALGWVWVDENDAVKVFFSDARSHRVGRVSEVRKLTLDFGDLASYRETVRDARVLHISDEGLTVLRERHREVGLSSGRESYDDGRTATTPLVIEELRRRRELPDDVIDDSVRLRTVELHADRQVKLSLHGLRTTGEPFTASVMFETLAAFNLASGERVTNQEFSRRTLLFWALGEGMNGRYVMKTRGEIQEHCAELLQFDVTVSPVNYVTPARPEPDSPANAEPGT